MSIFELFGEIFNPGPMGGFDFKDNRRTQRNKFITIRFVIALILLAGIEYLFLNDRQNYTDISYILKVNLFLLIYLFISSIIRVKPNTENLGWVPFIIDNPFRFSDDINRFLVVIRILFMPGKYISRSIVDFYRNKKN